MLFNHSGNRVFNALQSNGESRTVEYRVNDANEPVIVAVDGLNVIDAPLPPQFEFVVQGWIAEHRDQLQTHADFMTGNVIIHSNQLGTCKNQRPSSDMIFAAA